MSRVGLSRVCLSRVGYGTYLIASYDLDTCGRIFLLNYVLNISLSQLQKESQTLNKFEYYTSYSAHHMIVEFVFYIFSHFPNTGQFF